jgi:RNA polymerase sigma-70 factor (ECF subfamily)
MKQEEKIINLAKQGDKSAMSALYELHFDTLYKFIRYKVNSDEVAEDIVSEAFIKAFENLNKFKGKSTFKSWIYTIARNILVDWYKSKDKNISFDETYMNSQERDYKTDDADLNFLNEIMNELKDNYRQVLEHRFIYRMSIKETAEALDITAANVKVIQHRALKKAQKIGDKIIDNQK